MAWIIVLFESARGEKFVEEFINSLDQPTIAKAIHVTDLLEKHGPYLGMPHSKKLTSDLYELRVRGVEEIRIIYSFVEQNIYLLNSFKKKKEKTPRREIETSKNRLKSLT